MPHPRRSRAELMFVNYFEILCYKATQKNRHLLDTQHVQTFQQSDTTLQHWSMFIWPTGKNKVEQKSLENIICWSLPASTSTDGFLESSCLASEFLLLAPRWLICNVCRKWHGQPLCTTHDRSGREQREQQQVGQEKRWDQCAPWGECRD